MPEGSPRLRVLIIAPYLNGEGLGEVYSVFKWVEALCACADVTVLTVNDGSVDVAAQLPQARVVAFREPGVLNRRFLKLNRAAKPWIPIFFRQARRWVGRELAAGADFDILHQALPQAMRYAAPWHGLGLPFVVGPLAGSLETPPGFASEVGPGRGYLRLRALDRWRLRHDRALRRGYEDAGLVLGVAPYVGETLKEAEIELVRFEPMLERAHEGTFPEVERTSGTGDLHLLHVGRGVRSKGLRDTVRAMARLSDLPSVRLTSAGEGPEIELARAEAEALGVANRIAFLGQIQREEVDRLYQAADVFCLPSFREPMGGVFFEAMSWGLPVVAAASGGPDFILDNSCAVKVSVTSPNQFVKDIAGGIRRLAEDPSLRRQMGQAATDRLRGFGSWDDKAQLLETLYREVIAAAATSGD